MESVAKKKASSKKLVGPGSRPARLSRSTINKVEEMGIYEKINFIKKGVSKTQFEEIKKQTGLDYEILARILSVTKATLHNKKGAEKFNATISERLFRLVDIYTFGCEVFGEKEQFDRWLKSPIRSTGWIPPIELLDTVYGMEEVKNIIGRIAWGVLS
jgi:putative toxin-antitoxin system antitoxin component (TIGR02293 family)